MYRICVQRWAICFWPYNLNLCPPALHGDHEEHETILDEELASKANGQHHTPGNNSEDRRQIHLVSITTSERLHDVKVETCMSK